MDYFPHYVNSGRTILILQSKFGNDGYAFWFKLLELLCDTDNLVFDCNNSYNWEFLLAKTSVSNDIANEILNTLSGLGKIDAKLWGKRIIWIDNLVKNVSDVYKRRSIEIPKKPVFDNINQGNDEFPHTETQERDSLCEQEPLRARVLKESKLKESKEDIYPYQDIVNLWNSLCSRLPKVQKLNDNRRQKIKIRLNEFGGQKSVWIETAKTLFGKISESDFLSGENKSGWTATFDWLFENGSNWVKVMEGNYDNDRSKKGSGLTLGAGEYIDGSGRRTYGTGKAVIPPTAPPRPSDRYSWDGATSNWILL